ncbi:MAG: AAA family ATPase [Methanobacteriaceae archaeon]|nr:AAA family ATPase [Methanobacteriaceae archaeon]
MKVYGIAGLPGSGKGVIARIAKNEGMTVISMGNIIREEAQKTGKDTGKIAVELRRSEGKYVVAKRCVEKIRQQYKKKPIKNNRKIYTLPKKKTQPVLKKKKHDIFLIEGIRSPFEVEIFKKNFKEFKLIAIHSSPNSRFKRLKKRQRNDDYSDFNSFKRRDERELNFGIGNVIATSDYLLINEGSIVKFKQTAKKMIKSEIQKTTHKPRKKHNPKNKDKNKSYRKSPQNKKRNKKHPPRKPNNKRN